MNIVKISFLLRFINTKYTERERETVYYTSPQSLIITFFYLNNFGDFCEFLLVDSLSCIVFKRFIH